jgi:hypothetical protein
MEYIKALISGHQFYIDMWRNRSRSEYSDMEKLRRTPDKDLPLLIGSLVTDDCKRILEDRIRGENNV